jgi:hypothetical protein
MTPAATPAAAAASSFGLVFFIDLLFLLLLLRWPRCSAGSPVQAGRASLEQVLSDRLEMTRVPRTVFQVATEQLCLVLVGLHSKWNEL